MHYFWTKILVQKYCRITILVTDRGYYSENLINKLNEKKINYVLRITKKNIHYINNINNINKLKSGSIDINNNLKLFWFIVSSHTFWDNYPKKYVNMTTNSFA